MGGQGAQSLLFLLFMVAVFYFVLVRPQQRRVKRHQQVIAALQPGDEIVTIGGLYGYVKSLDEGIVHLEVAPGMVLRFARSAVREKVSPPELAASEVEEPEDRDSPA
ncbi:MAG TPA: preprotein translocase subunit YajC [Actinomycetota bacterium]